MRTVGELYPAPAAPVMARIVDAVCDGTEDGKPTLRRALEPAERGALEARVAELDRWLKPGAHEDLTESIVRMLSGMTGRSETAENALEIGMQYAKACLDRELPFWAVERACLRFASGQVKGSDVQDPSYSHSFGPRSAHVCILASSIVADTRAERAKLDGILKAVPGRSRAERPHSVPAQDWKLRRMEEAAAEDDRRRAATQQSPADLLAKAQQDVAEQYIRSGLEPPTWKPGQIPVSLAMMFKRGWRIETIGGVRTLVSATLNNVEEETV